MSRIDDLYEAERVRRQNETHPFLPKTFIPTERIERICLESLAIHRLMPPKPEPVRIERLLEKKWGMVEDYLDLPEGVLGAAAFDKSGLRCVALSRQFDDASNSITELRGRATMAHELGHGLLHEDLWRTYFFEAEQPTLFQEPEFAKAQAEPGVQMCREDAIMTETLQKSHFQWWEYQANQAMGFLLVPTALLCEAFQRGESGGSLELSDYARAELLCPELASTFKVSKSFMRCRLRGFFDVRRVTPAR